MARLTSTVCLPAKPLTETVRICEKRLGMYTGEWAAPRHRKRIAQDWPADAFSGSALNPCPLSKYSVESAAL